MLRAPSPGLQARIRARIDELPQDDSLGAWPLRFGKERGLLLVHGNQAYLWYLAPDGRLFALDTDDVARRLEPETGQRAVEAIEEAAKRHPELRDLLP